MKKKSLLLVTTALFILPVGSAFAAGDAGMSGSVELGGQLSDGADESAKFMEYQDLDNAVIGNVLFNYYQDTLFFDLEADRIGLDDQYYQLRGGVYGAFKFSLFYDEIPHNLSFDAKSFYSGIGSDSLTIGPGSPSSEATWNVFDYEIDTKKYGANAEFLRGSPFFMEFDVNREEKDGLRPLGSGSFSGAVELPEPVDYTTDNFEIAGGYRADEISFKLSGSYSSFNNSNTSLRWTNPFLGISEINSLPQDSDYGKLRANLTWRQLPMMSTFEVKGSFASLTSDLNAYDLGASIPSGLNTSNFDGEIYTTMLSAAFASHPAEKLDTRLFLEFYDRNNDSTVIEYNGGGNDEHLFGYTKYTAGIDADYKVASHTKLKGGYLFDDVERDNRPDGDSTMDNQLFLKLKNTSLDYLTTKIEYVYLNRSTDEEFDLVGVSMSDAEYITQFVQRYDVASKSKNSLKLAFELYPLDDLDFGASYTFVINDYDDVTLGRTEDKGHEFYIDVMWRASKMLTLSGFAGYEYYEADSNHFNFTAGSDGQIANPTIDDGNPSSYRWTQGIEENFWTVGLSAQMPLMQDRLQLKLLAQYQDSDGKSDFTTQGSSPLQTIDPYEDYYITTMEATASYAITEAIGLNLGYLYEKSSYDDQQYDGYDYTPGGTYLSGAYSDNDYEAHVGYLTVKYSF